MEFSELTEAIAFGNVSFERLRTEQRRQDGLIARVAIETDKTVIVKLWKRPGVNGLIRRLTRTGNLDREWKTLNLLYNHNINVPKALACIRFDSPKNGYTDALVIQDLGSCVRGIEILSQYAEQGANADSKRLKFEKDVINLTSSIIEAGIIDYDHHLVNILALPSGYAARIDFELASRVYFPKLFRYRLAKMISNLISTYCYAVQPNMELADDFSVRLTNQLNLSPNILKRIKVLVDTALKKQQQSTGIATHWTTPW
jgi:hypothetical protein